ncbi:MAG: glycoside hydrolase family 127 protein [Prevotella sp.]|nr:glycoside hydrolase family 127 protein [Prevotella sp.]
MLPNFMGRMWLTDGDGGSVAAIYGPSRVTYQTDKGDVTITCETDYPFSETLTFTVNGAEDASIPLTLRIPTWCDEATLNINGVAVNQALLAGSFVRLSDPVKQGDIVTLTLPMTVEKKELPGQGVCFQRGPLLFSYAIPQQMTEDTEEYPNMHGKKPENPDFKCWNITPTGHFNYAYASDGMPIEVFYPDVEEIGGTIPFDLNYANVKLRVPVKQIAWDLVDGRYTPAMPEQGHLELLSNETQYIELVPYGCTELRLTIFPDANAEALPTPAEPDYTRPADAPDSVTMIDGRYCAYFELPRFCWDTPIYCKVRTANGTTDLQSNEGGDLCELVGTTAIGREVWRWTGPAISEPQPVEIIFTNHDLLTDIMPFDNGGYYNYASHLYNASQTTGIVEVEAINGQSSMFNGQWSMFNDARFMIDGRRLAGKPTQKGGVYIHKGKKQVVD